MKPMRLLLTVSMLSCCTSAALFADFSYQQSTRVTGGAIAGAMRAASAFSSRAREAMISTVVVKGHRMAHISADSAQIVDTGKETITTINFAKKTYSVRTFAQMKQMMEDTAQRMGQRSDQGNVNFKASIRQTGQSKVISGLNAKETILTLTAEGSGQKTGQQGDMVITSDIWLAPDIPGYSEVRELNRAMAAKLGWSPGQNFGGAMGRNTMMKGMAEAGKEMAKLNGVPVLQVMTVNGDAMAMPRAGAGAGSGGSPEALMEITTESSGFSTAAVDASKFDVPAGFQQVDPEMGRRGGRPASKP